ncbi:MAG: aspartyl/asparaginyl beta-hydroxylase domain-containing protein [Acidobacteria bacterium]|nr:aspartyl/asparaginyl beta-hydroxylase domain-containing protein [Acidobacteriota bacterium]
MSPIPREALESALLGTLAELRRQHGEAPLERVGEFVRMVLGRAPRPVGDPLQRPELYFFPGLDDRAWPDEVVPWMPRLEAGFAAVRKELDGLIASRAEFVPYVHGDGRSYRAEKFRIAPQSGQWTVYDLHEPSAEERCPGTVGLLRDIFRYDLGEPVTAQFSALRPGARIAPHCGAANFFLTAHLGVIVPPGCLIRVGAESRSWVEGRGLVFNDSFEHEVRHDGDSQRVVLIARYWHPALSAVEIEAVGTLHGQVIEAAGGTEESQRAALAALRGVG